MTRHSTAGVPVMARHRLVLASSAGVLLLAAMLLGLIPSTVDAHDALPAHSCGAAWFPTLDEISPQMIPACVGQSGSRANLATGLLMLAIVAGVGGALLSRPVAGPMSG